MKDETCGVHSDQKAKNAERFAHEAFSLGITWTSSRMKSAKKM